MFNKYKCMLIYTSNYFRVIFKSIILNEHNDPCFEENSSLLTLKDDAISSGTLITLKFVGRYFYLYFTIFSKKWGYFRPKFWSEKLSKFVSGYFKTIKLGVGGGRKRTFFFVASYTQKAFFSTTKISFLESDLS